ncbi:MAG: AMP-binding protein [Rhodothermales bacterium]
MMNASLQERLYRRLDEAPESKAIAYYDPKDTLSWISYEQFYTQSLEIAAQLSKKGLQPGDVCAIVLPSGHLAARSIMAVLQLGGNPLLVAPPAVQGSLLDLPKILKHTVRKSGAKIVLCADTMKDLQEDLSQDLEGVELLFGEDEIVLPGEGADIERFYPSSDAIGAMQLTSGTTGFPRVCVWSQEGILAALDGMEAACGITTEDICFNWTPLYHDMGLINNFMLCMTAGIPLILFSPHEFVKRPYLWLKAMQDTGSTFTWSPNFGYAITAQRTRDRQIEGLDLSHVKAFWNAAERIHYDTVVAFYERFKDYGLQESALKMNFGCAENVGGATFTAMDEPYQKEHLDASRLYGDWIADEVPEGQEGAVTIVSCGQPHPTLGIEILSDDNERLPEGHVGRVALRTPSRLLYFKEDQESTDAAHFEDLLLTGDIGYKRNNNLYWVGREKERIVLRGKKYDPSDFEPILFDVEGLRTGSFVVFGVDEGAHGTQRVVIVTEVREPLEKSLEDISADISKQVFLRLGVTVSDIELVKAGTLAKTSSGKRRHRHFGQMYKDGKLKQYRVDESSIEADVS